MQTIQQTKGLKFPDEFVIKYFFKENLHRRRGRVLELGCGNGNNLMLFFQYGWDCVGIDYNEQSIGDAVYNFGQVPTSGNRFSFIQHDLQSGLPSALETCDVLLLPNVLYYIPRLAAITCLEQAADLVTPGGGVFLRLRSPRDYRYRRGREVEPNGFILDISETGENGALMVFYEEYELVEMLRNSMGIEPASLRLMRVTYDNLQNGCLVRNDEIVIWGELTGAGGRSQDSVARK